MHIKLRSRRVLLTKGGAILQKKKLHSLLNIHEKEEPIIKTNTIMVGRMARPVLEEKQKNSFLSQNVVGGDIMDFNKAVNRHMKKLHNHEEKNIRFVY